MKTLTDSLYEAWQAVQGDNGMDYLEAIATGERKEMDICYALVHDCLFNGQEITGDFWYHHRARHYVCQVIDLLPQIDTQEAELPFC